MFINIGRIYERVSRITSNIALVNMSKCFFIQLVTQEQKRIKEDNSGIELVFLYKVRLVMECDMEEDDFFFEKHEDRERFLLALEQEINRASK